jgi:hypothetical protein
MGIIAVEKLIETLNTHTKAIKKLVEVTDEHKDRIDNGYEIALAQSMLNDIINTRLTELETAIGRIDDMEEYIDTLTKRIKQLESRENK